MPRERTTRAARSLLRTTPIGSPRLSPAKVSIDVRGHVVAEEVAVRSVDLELGVCNQKLRERPQWSTVVEMCISHRSDDDPRSRLQVQPKLNGPGRDFQIRAVGPCPQTRVLRLELGSSLIWPS